MSDFIWATYAFCFVLANFGMANAARIPMITTTINSSISVNPRAFTALPSGRERASTRQEPRYRRPYCGHYPPFLQEACLTLRVDPILSGTDSYDERHPETDYPLHLAFYQCSGIRLLALGDLKHELVVHLKEHLGAQVTRFERGVDPDHRDLDQVRCRALERGVGRGALSKAADAEVPVA